MFHICYLTLIISDTDKEEGNVEIQSMLEKEIRILSKMVGKLQNDNDQIQMSLKGILHREQSKFKGMQDMMIFYRGQNVNIYTG